LFILNCHIITNKEFIKFVNSYFYVFKEILSNSHYGILIKNNEKKANLVIAAVILGLLVWQVPALIDNESCLDCHSDPDLEMERGGRTVSLYVDSDVFSRSQHADLDCIGEEGRGYAYNLLTGRCGRRKPPGSP